VGEAEFLEERSHITLVKIDAECLSDDALEVYASPAHDAVPLAIRSRLDDLGECGQLLRRQARFRTIRPIVEEAFRASGVEAMHPIAQRLPIHPANPRGLAAVLAVADRRQRQKPPALIDVLRTPGQSPQLLGREILS